MLKSNHRAPNQDSLVTGSILSMGSRSVSASDTATDPRRTRDLVMEAADQLLAEHVRPTVANVRERIGRGSTGTINAALRDWWDRLAERLASLADRPDIPAPIYEAAQGMWASALQEAEIMMAAERKTLEEQRTTADESVAVARADLEKARQQVIGLQQRVETADAERLAFERRIATANARVEALNTRVQELKTLLGERTAQHEAAIANERTHSDGLERHLMGQIEEHRSGREHAEKALVAREAAFRSRETQLQSEIRDARETVGALRGELGAFRTQIQELTETLEDSRTSRDTLVKEVADTTAERARAEETSARMQAANDALKAELVFVRKQYTDLEAMLRDSGTKLAVTEAELRTLRAAVGQSKVRKHRPRN